MKLQCKNSECNSQKVSIISYHKGVYKIYCSECKKTSYQGLRIDPIKRKQLKIGNNKLCTCGSGKKYKHCCKKKVDQKRNFEYERVIN